MGSTFIPIGIRLIAVERDHSLVKYKFIFLSLGNGLYLFGGWTSDNFMRVFQRQCRLFLVFFMIYYLGEHSLSHETKIQYILSTYIQSKPSDFTRVFTVLGDIGVVFRTRGHKLDDMIACIELRCVLSQVIPDRDISFSRFYGVYDTVRVHIEDTFLEGT